MSGSDFGWVGVGQENGIRKIMWDKGEGPVLKGRAIWFRGINNGDTGRLLYSLDGKIYVDTGVSFSPDFQALERQPHLDFQLRPQRRFRGFRLCPLPVWRDDRSVGLEIGDSPPRRTTSGFRLWP